MGYGHSMQPPGLSGIVDTLFEDERNANHVMLQTSYDEGKRHVGQPHPGKVP